MGNAVATTMADPDDDVAYRCATAHACEGGQGAFGNQTCATGYILAVWTRASHATTGGTSKLGKCEALCHHGI